MASSPLGAGNFGKEMGNGARRDKDAATMAAGDRIALALPAAEVARFSDMSQNTCL